MINSISLIVVGVFIGSSAAFAAENPRLNCGNPCPPSESKPIQLPLPADGVKCRSTNSTLQIEPDLKSGSDRLILSLSENSRIPFDKLKCRSSQLDTFNGSGSENTTDVVLQCEPLQPGAWKPYVLCSDRVQFDKPYLSPRRPDCMITDGFANLQELGLFDCQ